MCGIAGFAGNARLGDAELRAMCGAIVHRGPDDEGRMIDGDVGLGMRRLSIIDVAGGHQPISNEDGSVTVVFNGEIYNFAEIARDLERRGHVLRTRTDTEVLVHLYEERGAELVHALRGMFAFALWDRTRGRLLLARDRLGIKPLYYTTSGGGLAFASELKALQRLQGAPRDIDPAAVASYLAFGYVPDPLCVLRGVRKLEPGHRLLWERGGAVRTERYWTPVRPEDSTIDDATAIAETRRLLEESVRYRLIADVPLGAFLSGGIDSTGVVALMARELDQPVQTYSIGFEEPEYNEAPDARRAAQALGTDHTDMIVRPDVDDLVERIVVAFDEPFADSSAVPTFLVSELASRRLKVVLSGDGGDEVFGGYTRYADWARRGPVLPPVLAQPLRGTVRTLPRGMRGRGRLLDLTRDAHARYVGMVADPLSVAEGGVARARLAQAAGPWDDLLARAFEQAQGRDPLTQLMLVDMLTYLPGDILTKVDRMSMAVSLEARVPLLDHVLVEFAMSLPGRMKLRDGTGKWVLREALRGLVPESVFAKRKQGFAVPLRPWLRGPLTGRIEGLLSAGATIHEYVDPAAVRSVVGEHRTGRRDHSPLLWKLIVLGLWLDRFADAPSGAVALEVA